MRRARLAGVLVLCLALAGPASADGVNNLLAGLNGIITAPADPVMETVHPPAEFGELPGAVVTGRVLGFLTGTLQMVQRAGMGLCDVAFSPFWVFPTLSPQARYEIIPGYEIEYDY